MSHLTDAPIDSQDLVKRVMRPSDGACVVFEGVVRNHHQGKSVESILYEAYRPMAEKEITKILDDINTRFPQVAVAVTHRLGLLKVGDASIVIACSSPHRGEAFEVCRAVIDRFKQTVPIWKKERGPGGEEWVGWQK
ncbi:MAG: molybdenum cofactor biosynthesis protein MoaE [Acidobacteriota bacterium]|nr:molybdenum cofactor biosynthesis protein MoaE [Acidobacteriota bacterium]